MKRTKAIALAGVMTALALALSYFERLIPLQLLIPLPGIKLGLANIATLAALYLTGAPMAWTVLILRCILGAMFGGGVTGFLFSAAGGILAMGVMTAARKCPLFSVYGVSILGAAAHNTGQVAMAIIIMQSPAAGAYLPYLLIVSIFTGAATGIACAGVLRIFRHISISI